MANENYEKIKNLLELKNQGIVLSSDTTQSMHLKKDSNIQLHNYLLKKDTCGRTFCSIIEDKDGNFRLVKDNICYLSNCDSWEQTTTIYELFTKDEASQLIQSINSNLAYKINYLNERKVYICDASGSKIRGIEPLYLFDTSYCATFTRAFKAQFPAIKMLDFKNFDYDSYLAMFKCNNLVRNKGYGKVALNRIECAISLLCHDLAHPIRFVGEMIPLDTYFSHKPNKNKRITVDEFDRKVNEYDPYSILKSIYEKLGFNVYPMKFQDSYSGKTIKITLLDKYLKPNSEVENLEK